MNAEDPAQPLHMNPYRNQGNASGGIDTLRIDQANEKTLKLDKIVLQPPKVTIGNSARLQNYAGVLANGSASPLSQERI